MRFECKVFDKNGKLKKIIDPKGIVNGTDKMLRQKSTQRAIESIRTFRQAKPRSKADFCDRVCLFCEKKFYPRNPSAKYCSQECQKNFYKREKSRKRNVDQ